jgi:hypothetical protein
MAIGEKQVVTIEGKRYACTNVFEGDYINRESWEGLDTLAVLCVDHIGLYVTTLNRQPITNPVPKGVAIQAMMNRMQTNMVA